MDNKKILDKLNKEASQKRKALPALNIMVGGGGNRQIRGVDPGGASRDVEVDENGNLRVDLVSGVTVSTEVSGVSRQTNPTATADGATVKFSADDLGRMVITPYQVRDLISTGSATLVRGTETAVVSAVASTLIDIVTITGSNTSGIAQNIDIRVGTGGSIIDKLTIPITSVVSKTYHVPLLSSEVAQVWTAQNSTQADLSDSPVTITMVGIQNI